jgi:hypothetical protein
VGLENNLININKMNVEDFYNESEYSKIDFGSNPTLFTKKELLDFANEYLEAITVTRCCESDSEQLICERCKEIVDTLEDDVRCEYCSYYVAN